MSWLRRKVRWWLGIPQLELQVRVNDDTTLVDYLRAVMERLEKRVEALEYDNAMSNTMKAWPTEEQLEEQGLREGNLQTIDVAPSGDEYEYEMPK